MNNNQNQPREFDVVLGGENPAPVTGVVLGGIEGVKRRLESEIVDVRIKALNDALGYGDEGLDLVIKSLRNKSKVIQRNAYKILKKREETQVKQALEEYKPWYLSKRLQTNNQLDVKSQFSNLQVVNYNPKIGITNPRNTAYALTYDSSNSIADDIKVFESLAKESQASKLEAIVIVVLDSSTERYSEIFNALVNAKKELINLKALYIGSWGETEIKRSDIIPVLTAYPQLEILETSRRKYGLNLIEPVEHKNLRALIVRSDNLYKDILSQIDNIKLPALEHFESLFENSSNRQNFSIEHLKPILENLIFPDLSYLGLRESQFADEIAEAVVNSPLIKTISVLDLSLGRLTDKGAEFLLNCAAVNELDILNVSETYLSEEMIGKLSALDCRVLAEKSPRVIRCGTNVPSFRILLPE